MSYKEPAAVAVAEIYNNSVMKTGLLETKQL
jgi:hypothetical protein